MGCHRSIEDGGCKGLKKADVDHRMVSEGHCAEGVVVAVGQAGPGVRTQMVGVRIGEGIVALGYSNLRWLVLPHKHEERGINLVAEPQGQEYSIYLDQQWAVEDHLAVVAGIHRDLHHTQIEVGSDDHTVAVLAGT